MTEDYPSERLVALFDPAQGRLMKLIELLAPVARRRPDRWVDRGLLDAARAALRDVERLTSRLPAPKLLPLHAPVSALGLLAVLGQAEAALDLFAARYRRFDDEALAFVWQTRELMSEGRQSK